LNSSYRFSNNQLEVVAELDGLWRERRLRQRGADEEGDPVHGGGSADANRATLYQQELAATDPLDPGVMCVPPAGHSANSSERASRRRVFSS
jgi:hypothetical protein